MLLCTVQYTKGSSVVGAAATGDRFGISFNSGKGNFSVVVKLGPNMKLARSSILGIAKRTVKNSRGCLTGLLILGSSLAR